MHHHSDNKQNGPKNGPKMDPKWTPKWTPKWNQNGPKMDPKWTQNGPKMDTELDTHISEDHPTLLVRAANTIKDTVRLIAVELAMDEISAERRLDRVIRSPTAYALLPVSDETMNDSSSMSIEICSTMALLWASTSTLILRNLIADPSSVKPTCSPVLSDKVVPLSWSPTVSLDWRDERADARSSSTKLSLGLGPLRTPPGCARTRIQDPARIRPQSCKCCRKRTIRC